jgi:enterochelin esterase family protein
MRYAYVSISAVLLVSCLFAFVAYGEQVAKAKSLSQYDQYVLGPDSEPSKGVPEGRVTEFWLENSTTYPGVRHRWWLYIPAQYDGKNAIALMVFQDGSEWALRDGEMRVPVVLNNLIAKKELPVMAAAFVDPGEYPDGTHYEKAPDGSPLLLETYHKSVRTMEYETLNSTYADFLVNEILPKVREHVKIADDPDGRGIAGGSSGANCALTVAWERPDQFRKVFSAVGEWKHVNRGTILHASRGSS